MSSHLHWIDWTILVLYLLAIIAFGVWLGRGQKTTRDYFLGNRSIPWWGVGLSIVATETSALTFIGVPAMAYGGNLAFLQIVIGYVIARVLLAIWFVPQYFKGEIYSPYQLFGDAYGPAARRTAGGFFLISGTLAAGVRVYVTAIPIQLMLGIEVSTAILLFVVLSLIYTYVGGIKAVVWTDAIQFGLFMLGGIFCLVYVPQLLSDESGWWKAAVDAGKTQWLNVLPGQTVSWSEFLLALPLNLWMGLIGATVFVAASHGADQLIVQRVLTCRNQRDGRRALLLSAVIIFPLFVVFLLVGTMLWAFYQAHPMGIPIPTDKEGFRQNDYIFPIFILTEVPVVLKGLLIVAVLSAAMSSVSSALSALASVSTMDFVRGLLGGERDERFYFKFSRHSTVVWGGILVLVAVASQQQPSVLTLAFSLNGLTNGAMLGGLMLALWWRRGRAAALITGMFTSLVFMVLLHFLPRLPAVSEWYQREIGLVVAWPWYTLIGASIAIGVALLVEKFLSRPRQSA